MADPWSSDFAALGDESRHGLRSLQATRASLPKDSPMRFHKAHPALAALIALLVVGVTAPLAYAFVRHILVTVDPDKPTDQIQQDVTDQLKAAGVEAKVKAEKSDNGPLSITIKTTDENLGSDLEVNVGGQTVHAGTGRGIYIECENCDEAAQKATYNAVMADAVTDLIDGDAAIGPAIKKALADIGYASVDVTVTADKIAVTVHPKT